MRHFDDAALERLVEMLATRPADELAANGLRRACVLIPLVRTGSEWSLVFVLRSEELKHHSGQIAFPGGVAENDERLEETATRETEEEIGVAREQIRVIGRLDDLVTRTGFIVAPFVGIVPSGIAYVPQEREVREVFEVPLAALFESNNPEIRLIPYKGETYPSYFYRYEAREIWGLTGRMLKGFLDLVRIAM